MPLSFERFVAARYLKGAQGRESGRRFLRFVTYVAIGGVAVGVAALLLALSIVRGFSREIEAKIVGFGAHVQVESFQDAPLDRAGRLAGDLAALPGVVDVAPVVTEFALLRRSATDIEGVAVWGTDDAPAYLADHLVDGAFDFAADDEGRPGVVLGAGLAGLLDVDVGDLVTAFSMRNAGAAGAARRPRVKQFRVRGLYETDLANFDELYAFTSLAAARTLLDYRPDEVTRFDLTLADVEQADTVARTIEENFGFPILARTIYDVFRSLFAWVNLQESIIPLVISVIVIVAAFNIIGALLMLILEKTREMGILVSMGASARTLRRLFLGMGLLIGFFGVVIGEAAALALALAQQRYEIIPLPADAYYMTTAPVELNLLDFVWVGVATMLLCALAAYVPARVASRVEPVRAIRFR